MTFLYPTTLAEACALIGAEHEQTGGGCTALVVRPREDFEILITSQIRDVRVFGTEGNFVAPEDLDEPVIVCSYDSGNVLDHRTFPTLLAAVMDIYGPIAEVSA